jgi:hypothetical protein
VKKNTYSFFIRPTAKTKRDLQMIQDEWLERAEKLQDRFTQVASDHVLKNVVDRIPTKDEWSAYRDSLEVVNVATEGRSIFAIRSDSRARGISKVDVPRTVLYIRPRRKLSRIRPEIKILERFNPWTINTLPFTPKRSDAQVISRKVQKLEVEEVEKDRKRDRKVWQKELARVGFRQPTRSKRLQVSKRVKALPDVAFEALRLEFGAGGTKARPHWRPGIRSVMTGSGVRHVGSMEERVSAMLKTGFRSWRSWPQKAKKTILAKEAKGFVPFQKKLNIRVG